MDNSDEKARKALAKWRLGQSSERYESSGMGAGTISTGKNDHGGVSYGAYQLSSKAGTLQEYLAQSVYGKRFGVLRPATPEFDAKWREIARIDSEFGRDQRDFIGRSHYQQQVERLKAMGLPLDDRGRAVQDLLWSTSVQFRDLTPTIVSSALKEFAAEVALPNLTDRQIVEAVQDYKRVHNNALFKSSPGLWPGLIKRTNSEKSTLLELAGYEAFVRADSRATELGVLRKPYTESEPRNQPSVDLANPKNIPMLRLESFSAQKYATSIEELQQQLLRLGYRDAQGHLLAIDNTFGPNTKHAVESFQRAHHLQVDGIVGKHTRAALKDALHAPLLSEATNPQHHLYAQILHGIHKLPQGTYRNERERTNAAVALTISAHVAGLREVDHVVLGRGGTNLFAVQGRMDDPAHRRVHVDHVQAMSQSLDHGTPVLQVSQVQQPMHAMHAVHSQIEQRGAVLGISR